MKTVLVLDSDLGFVTYLCLTLANAGYLALPALTADQAKELLTERSIFHVDAVVVDLDTSGALEIAKSLRRNQTKVIAVENTRRSEFQTFQIAATLRRSAGPSAGSDYSSAHCFRWPLIRSVNAGCGQ